MTFHRPSRDEHEEWVRLEHTQRVVRRVLTPVRDGCLAQLISVARSSTDAHVRAAVTRYLDTIEVMELLSPERANHVETSHE